MSDSRFVITGAVGGSPNRLEIHDFIKNDKFFSLYIQALKAISEQDQSILLSFFQVGGIHGLPYVVWDGSTGSPPTPDQWEGYCTHGSVLFPTWHRPYVMLYEQILQKRAIEIAATYQIDKEAWKQAAVNLRQPFWDWAKNSVPPDEVIVLKQVTITGPDGKLVKVDNPLYQYKFHPIDPSFPGPYGVWPTTLRHPTSTGADATDDITALKNALSSAQTDITTKTYNLLTRVLTWPAFSNHTVGNGGSTSNSLEGIHDGIHFDVGANGHMGNAGVAGFDPIFFLHHANVDRLLSLWFALHSVWVSPGSSNDGSLTIALGITVDQTTALTPFWNAQTTFWPSSAIEDTSKLGYTYPEFNGLRGGPDVIRTAIGGIINRLYSSPVSSAPFDWAARIEFKKYEVGTSFAVLLFLGAVPENPKDFRTSPNYVGAHYAFVNSAAQHCGNCRNQQDIVVEGFVHLNPAIVKLSGLGSLAPDVVKPYLTNALHWKVQKADGTVVELESLEVSVFATPLSYPPGTLFPVPGESTRHNGVTHGRRGGSRQALHGQHH